MMRVIYTKEWTAEERSILVQLWEQYKRCPLIVEQIETETDVGEPILSFLGRDGQALVWVSKIEGVYEAVVADGGMGSVLYRGASMDELAKTLWMAPTVEELASEALSVTA